MCLCVILMLQILSLLRDSSMQGPIYRAVVAVLEAMQARQSDLAYQLVTKPLLEPLFKCLDSTGKVITVHFINHIEIFRVLHYAQSHVDS